MTKSTRRGFLNAALALSGGSYLTHYEALAVPSTKLVRITDIKAMQLRRSGCLVKIETDAGLAGYGEAGGTGPIVRPWIETLKRFLVGQDPLAIERHYQVMTNQMHPYMAHIPTVSGIDIALWDLAGKIIGLPVSTLMGGPFRDRIRLYTGSSPTDMLDPASCRDWAQRMKADPMGWTTVKVDFRSVLESRPVTLPLYPQLHGKEIARIERGLMNVRQALGPDDDIAVHCHNEFDLPSSIAVARAIEPAKPMWFEDPMPVTWVGSWTALKRSSRVPILTGEKLELPKGFFQFLANQAVDMIQPDLAFCGGLTGGKKIADLADMYHIPLNTHNNGVLVLTMASVHFGAAIRNYSMSEGGVGLGSLQRLMAASNPPVVKNSYIDVPKGPGLGFELNADVLRKEMAPSEPWWG